MKPTVGISYRLWPEVGFREGLGQYILAACLVESVADGTWRVATDRSVALSFALSVEGGWVPRDSDSSSTMGLLGGVDDPKQARLSEALERNVADITALVLARWADHEWAPDRLSERADVWLLGPALPKLVGRLASFRYGERLDIRWATIRPTPKWYSLYPPFLASLAGLSPTPEVLEALRIWTMGDLVSVGGGCAAGSAACIVEALTSTGAVRPIADVELLSEFRSAGWLGHGVCLPAALRASSLLLESGDYSEPLAFNSLGDALELSRLLVAKGLLTASAVDRLSAGATQLAARDSGLFVTEPMLDECSAACLKAPDPAEHS